MLSVLQDFSICVREHEGEHAEFRVVRIIRAEPEARSHGDGRAGEEEGPSLSGTGGKRANDGRESDRDVTQREDIDLPPASRDVTHPYP